MITTQKRDSFPCVNGASDMHEHHASTSVSAVLQKGSEVNATCEEELTTAAESPKKYLGAPFKGEGREKLRRTRICSNVDLISVCYGKGFSVLPVNLHLQSGVLGGEQVAKAFIEMGCEAQQSRRNSVNQRVS